MNAPIGQLAGHRIEKDAIIIWGHPMVGVTPDLEHEFTEIQFHGLIDFHYLRDEWDLLCSLEENYSLWISISPESALFSASFISLFDGSVTSLQCRDIRIRKVAHP